MRIDLHIDGLETLDRKLANLPGKIAKGAVRRAVRNAQKIVLNALRAKTAALPISERRQGRMRDLIAQAWQIRTPRRQIPGSYSLHVTLPPGAFIYFSKRTRQRSYIPAAIEYGHGATKEKAARPFARPAADESKSLVEMVLAHDLAQGIERAALEAP